MNDFQILSKLGEGTYSTVYKVKRLIDNNIYALKKVKLLNLSEKEKSNALNEVRILASIKSPYIISYKEAFFDEKDSTLCIIMEYAENGDLYQKIISNKEKSIFFSEIEIWKIFIQLVKGLKSLHDLNILHRDLKSANIFIFKDNNIKLGDLNVSKIIKKGLLYTQTGTPYYASPEVWKDLPYDNKSDIWSLGIVLYEIITLKTPFRSDNMEGLYSKIIKGNFSKIPNFFSNDIFSIVKLLIQVNPLCRPSCDEILRNPIVNKRIEFFSSFDENFWSQDEFFSNKELLRTIKIPKNLLFLSNNLPKPNYVSCINIKRRKKNFRKSNQGKIVEEKIPPVKVFGKEKDRNWDKNVNDKNNFYEKNLDNYDDDNDKSNDNENYKSNDDNNKNFDEDNDKSNINKYININYDCDNKYHHIKRDDSIKLNHNDINNNICYKNKEIIEISNDLPQLNYINYKKKNKKNKYINKNKSHSHLDEFYKIYVPYLNKPEIMYNKYKLERIKYDNNDNYDYIKKLEKYYEKIHNCKYNQNDLLRENSNSHKNYPEIKVIPKRKLSPIRRNLINIY